MIHFTPSELISTAESPNQKIELLQKQIDLLRYDLEDLFDELEKRIESLET